jgi:hypothetical protein
MQQELFRPFYLARIVQIFVGRRRQTVAMLVLFPTGAVSCRVRYMAESRPVDENKL